MHIPISILPQLGAFYRAMSEITGAATRIADAPNAMNVDRARESIAAALRTTDRLRAAVRNKEAARNRADS